MNEATAKKQSDLEERTTRFIPVISTRPSRINAVGIRNFNSVIHSNVGIKHDLIVIPASLRLIHPT